ncbi:MAG: 2-dehydropantoate 2-reductase [Dehalococcoidia bacterium]
MKVAVMGAGAVGGYFGGVLARNGEDVTLICRGAHRDAIVKDGLKVSSHWGDFTVSPAATPDPSKVGPVDLVLHCVKLYSNAEALPLIRPMIGPDTTILTVQNGVTSGAIIAGVYGWERVLQGATYIEAAMTGLGQIEQSGSVAKIEFGEKDGSRSSRTDAIQKLLDKPGIQVDVSSDIVGTLWSKLVSVASIGTVVTAARATLPEVLAGSEGERTIRTVMEEIVAVGQSQGVKFAPRVVDTKLEGAKEEAEEFKSSLQFDLYNGRPLEIDDILGAVVVKGREAGIPVPASAALVTVLEKLKKGSPH